MYKNQILSSNFFDAIPILYQMLDSVDARCRFRLIVPSLVQSIGIGRRERGGEVAQAVIASIHLPVWETVRYER